MSSEFFLILSKHCFILYDILFYYLGGEKPMCFIYLFIMTYIYRNWPVKSKCCCGTMCDVKVV